MKKLFMFSAVAVIGLSAFTGCKKSDSSSPAYDLNATINSAAYSSTNCSATVNSGVLEVVSNLNNTSGAITYPTVLLAINNYTGVGTYNLTANAANIYAVDSSASSGTSASYGGGSGTVTISSASSSVIAGTFSFTCSNGTVVSGGTFTAKVY